MTLRKWLSISTAAAALAFVAAFFLSTTAESSAKRSGNVSIQILATADNQGELEECG